MKLYGNPLSPFAARVKIALAYKGLTAEEIVVAPAELKTPHFLQKNPMGKIPVLEIDEDLYIPESETIIAYLEDAYPERPLLPKDALGRAKVRNVIRVTDNYVCPPMFRLFRYFPPAERDEVIIQDELSRLRAGLGFLNNFVASTGHADGHGFSMADCILFPTLILVNIIEQGFGTPPLLAPSSNLATYFAAAAREPILAVAQLQINQAMAGHSSG